MSSIKTVRGNLFDYLKPGDAMVHGCNAQGVMGSGIALEVRNRYLGAFAAYRQTHSDHGLEPGDVIPFYDPIDKVWIINAVTQEYFGRDNKRYVSYDAVADCFNLIGQMRNNYKRLFFPKIGAGLGGGDWNVILEIIKSEMKPFDIELIYVEYA